MSLIVLVLIDGTRPDALGVAHCPNLTALRARGAFTLNASSVLPSVTLPCHMSIFHSVPPSRHGVTTNDWQPMARPLPGLVDQAHAASRRCAFFHNWEPLRNLNLPGSLAFSYFRDNVYGDLDGDQVIADEAVRYFATDQPDFAFVYFGTVDTIGHLYGWMSPEYLAQLERVDRTLGTLLARLPPEDMTIPWLVAGPGLRQGYEIKTAVSLLDTAPTLARLLGIKPHPQWEGRCIEEIFE